MKCPHKSWHTKRSNKKS